MKVCIFVVGIITLLFGVFGVFVPWTLSADSTSLNILGGLVILFTILFMCWFLPAVYKSINVENEVVLNKGETCSEMKDK